MVVAEASFLFGVKENIGYILMVVCLCFINLFFKVDLYTGCDKQYNCCDGEAILLRNHCFFVASLLSFLVRVA